METDVKILVRERELACRNAWGDDLWADSSSPTTTPAPEPQRKPFTFLNPRLDDEVTSVIDASAHDLAAPVAEDVVTLTSVRVPDAASRPTNDVNAGAVADQEERARVMARGSRDAILSARQRHALRRATNQPEPTVSEESVNPVTAEQTVELEAQTEATPIDASASANANGLVHEPAFSPDTVTSSVGLNRLRSFLRSDDDPASSDPTASAVHTSHFDHVMMQAERIKERSVISKAPDREAVFTAPEVVPDRHTHRPVVWDVAPEVLAAGFTKANTLVDVPALESVPTETHTNDVIQVATHRRSALYEATPLVASAPEQRVIETQPLVPDVDHVEDTVGDDEFIHAHDDDFKDGDPTAFDSPRSSLWRSFNQRLRRRFQVQAHSDQAYEPVIEDEASYQDEDDYLEAPERAEPAMVFHSSDPDTWYDPEQPTQVLANSVHDQHYAGDRWQDDLSASDEGHLWTATSEESWQLDEREFPEPQPVEWHRTRRELLASLPPVESLDDSVRFIAPTPQSTPVAPIAPRRPLPDPKNFFDISDPSGLAAFRVALFGSASRPTLDFMADMSGPAPSVQPSPSRLYQEYLSAPSPQDQYTAGDEIEENWSDADTRDMHQFGTTTQATSRLDEGRMAPPRRRTQRDVPIVAPVTTDKCCATCRSFLASEDGARGRCTNEWASRHRSVVEADELACRSSFGDWWIAADPAWLPPEDNQSPDRPTNRAPIPGVRTRNVG